MHYAVPRARPEMFQAFQTTKCKTGETKQPNSIETYVVNRAFRARTRTSFTSFTYVQGNDPSCPVRFEVPTPHSPAVVAGPYRIGEKRQTIKKNTIRAALFFLLAGSYRRGLVAFHAHSTSGGHVTKSAVWPSAATPRRIKWCTGKHFWSQKRAGRLLEGWKVGGRAGI